MFQKDGNSCRMVPHFVNLAGVYQNKEEQKAHLSVMFTQSNCTVVYYKASQLKQFQQRLSCSQFPVSCSYIPAADPACSCAVLLRSPHLCLEALLSGMLSLSLVLLLDFRASVYPHSSLMSFVFRQRNTNPSPHPAVFRNFLIHVLVWKSLHIHEGFSLTLTCSFFPIT